MLSNKCSSALSHNGSLEKFNWDRIHHAATGTIERRTKNAMMSRWWKIKQRGVRERNRNLRNGRNRVQWLSAIRVFGTLPCGTSMTVLFYINALSALAPLFYHRFLHLSEALTNSSLNIFRVLLRINGRNTVPIRAVISHRDIIQFTFQSDKKVGLVSIILTAIFLSIHGDGSLEFPLELSLDCMALNAV